jgi:hypothetical protein
MLLLFTLCAGLNPNLQSEQIGQRILYSPEKMNVSKGIYTFSIYLSQNLQTRKLQQKKIFTKLPQSKKNTFMRFWIPGCAEIQCLKILSFFEINRKLEFRIPIWY